MISTLVAVKSSIFSYDCSYKKLIHKSPSLIINQSLIINHASNHATNLRDQRGFRLRPHVDPVRDHHDVQQRDVDVLRIQEQT